MCWAKPIAYGLLKLKPQEFMDLTPGDFLDMVDGWQEARMIRLKETSVFVALLMNVHLDKKHSISPDKIFAAFQPPKTKDEIVSEREQFIAEFKRQREEALHGNHS